MGKIAFVFPGQGAQYIGMAKQLCDQYPKALEIVKMASEVLGIDMEQMIFRGTDEELRVTENTQPAILTASAACLQPVIESGIEADFTAGLSLGEYTAHVYSGTFSFSDAVKLVRKRGKFMQEAVPQGLGSMIAILGMEREEILNVCAMAKSYGIVEPVNFNCPGQIVIAGEVKAVEKAADIALEKGAKRAVPLSVSAPFHSSMMAPAGEKLKAELEYVNIKKMRIPVFANVTGEIVPSENQVKDTLVHQVYSSVLWEDIVKNMIRKGVDKFIEIGPGKVLSGFIKKIDRKMTVLNVEDINSLDSALRVLKG
ncbi:MAG: ACP S-malonyltransferase [Bacillota bacterium]|jgi:[acyl-carrier-protein] S-malonyltransferase|nr:ACP S-malonyltransferase [Bacillota bacterium]NLV64174.1 ACP S-malonyltransferase [Clostridiaceae bacterium]